MNLEVLVGLTDVNLEELLGLTNVNPEELEGLTGLRAAIRYLVLLWSATPGVYVLLWYLVLVTLLLVQP